ncbi:glycosyltransferase family 9 protein [Helicobacter sp.]|uniref:glycosyltransferase family 9 protein n=1 Tax=Helicobacter sp. TaxID=218 RepID=UPI0025C4439D|nr:glycosyltransferase family 9 protein [Helicobacter sp.]MCI5968477.1 glycosyltransferase family 9 protein [Helicobacter sp.]MDY2585262.1 glycosyltransferase family 9 protein [Helicobacter sp.]
MKILIIKLNKIGDVLLTSPLFTNLKAHFGENCQIDMLVNAGTEGLLETTLLQAVHLLKRPNGIFKKLQSNIALLFTLRAQKYNIVLGLGSNERTAFTAFITGAKVRVGIPPHSFWAKHIYTHKIPYKAQHNIESNLDALRLLKIPILDKSVRAKVAKNSTILENLPPKFVHCHFFSDWLFKCLDDNFCVKIVDFITQTYQIPCVLTAAPNDSHRLKTLQTLTQSQIFPISNFLLEEIALLNTKAKAFVGVDTSIMHLSAANGIPTFAFFGPSFTQVWGPWDNALQNSTYKNQKGGIQNMGKHYIYQEPLACMPCGKAGCENSQKSDCLSNKLNQKSALKALKNFLDPLLAKQ